MKRLYELRSPLVRGLWEERQNRGLEEQQAAGQDGFENLVLRHLSQIVMPAGAGGSYVSDCQAEPRISLPEEQGAL